MKINFHPRGTSKTIIDKDLEAVDYFCISTVAYAAIPSCRPVKPNFSVVVALMEISSTSTWLFLIPIFNPTSSISCSILSNCKLSSVLISMFQI